MAAGGAKHMRLDAGELLDLALTPRQTLGFEEANAASRNSDQQLLGKTSARQEASALPLPSRDDFALCQGVRVACSDRLGKRSLNISYTDEICFFFFFSFSAESQILGVCCPTD